MKEEDGLIDDEKKLLLEGVAQGLVAIHRAKVLRDEPARRGDARPRLSADELFPPSGDLLFKLMQAEVDKLKAVLGFNRKRAGELFDKLRERAESCVSPRPPIVLALSGPAGKSASGTRELSNHRREPVQVHFRPSLVRDRSGDAFPGANPLTATVDPASQPVPPRGKCAVHVTARLDDPWFKAGQCYFAEIEVIIRGEVADRLAIEITVEHAA